LLPFRWPDIYFDVSATNLYRCWSDSAIGVCPTSLRCAQFGNALPGGLATAIRQLHACGGPSTCPERFRRSRIAGWCLAEFDNQSGFRPPGTFACPHVRVGIRLCLICRGLYLSSFPATSTCLKMDFKGQTPGPHEGSETIGQIQATEGKWRRVLARSDALLATSAPSGFVVIGSEPEMAPRWLRSSNRVVQREPIACHRRGTRDPEYGWSGRTFLSS
jgi:hypothetical protein